MAEQERRLREDPEYRAAVEQAEAGRVARAQELQVASLPVLTDLRSVGVEVDSLWHLYEQPNSYDAAIPVLLDHMRREYPERTLEDIGHALPFKPPAKWWDEFKALYLATGSDAVRDRLGAALASCAIRKHYEDLLRFIHDEALGESRIYFLRPINRIGNRMNPGQGRAVIEPLADDPVLGGEATAILRGLSRSQ
jgi:hypothetical protein